MKVFLEALLERLGEVLGATLLLLATGSTPDYSPKLGAEASLTILKCETIRVGDPEKFLNDVMLSPH